MATTLRPPTCASNTVAKSAGPDRHLASYLERSPQAWPQQRLHQGMDVNETWEQRNDTRRNASADIIAEHKTPSQLPVRAKKTPVALDSKVKHMFEK